MISSARNRITKMYQAFQVLKKGIFSFSVSVIFYFFLPPYEKLAASNPNTTPISNPIETRFISIPITSPIIITITQAIFRRVSD
jgi:hypothetical protein